MERNVTTRSLFFTRFFTRRSFCHGLAAIAVLPLAARCGAITQTHPQTKNQTNILKVPGARLYYETHGSGPVMLMVPGASGTADSFRRVTEHLAAHYKVIIYDRRGFSRSQPMGRRTTIAGSRPTPMMSGA